ncbi:MAG: peptidoglycan D,D-transpeptidase FtsI family protein [Bacillus sp. (in: firmicutes)]
MEKKTKKKKKNFLLIRLNVIFFVAFLLFVMLILRLGYIQIVQGEEYKKESERTTTTTYSWNVPRGQIYDREGRALVVNDPIYTLTYTDSENTSDESTLTIAEKLANLIDVDIEDVKDRDKKDYWIQLHSEQALEKVSDKEREELDDSEEYKLLLERITDEELATLTDEEIKVYMIKAILDSDSASVKRIKEELDTEEVAIINEHLSDLPGVDVKADSQRSYVYGDTFKQIFGKVASIPAESADLYKAQGYSLDDTVGKSFLELQYENLLRGTKEVQTTVTDSTGTVTDTTVSTKGETGKDVVLTIDINLQQKVDQIVEEEFAKEPSADGAYVVMMNPKTGEILAISGKNRDGSKIEDNAYGAIYNAYAMGSAVKGATVLTGYQTGVINPGDVLLDTPITIGGLTKKSWTTMGSINDLKALERSSNVYMFRIAMKIAGYDLASKTGFTDPDAAYETMRYYFAQFGLGVETGIDLPSEATGYNGGVQKLGNLMDLAIGQFDTYTTLQLAQYVSTIANDGYRMRPHLLKEVHEPDHASEELGEVIDTYTPQVLNRVDMDLKDIQRVQQGFRLVMSGSQGTAASHFRDASYNPAGKTGTAQIGSSYNLTLVTYAPYENPEIAAAIVVDNISSSSSAINKKIGRRILDAYFEEGSSSTDEKTETE